MPDKRRHRGPNPRDEDLFATPWHDPLRRAAAHMQWLLDRDYGERAVLKLVGDRFRLRGRQRQALQRGVCTSAQAADRNTRRLADPAGVGEGLLVDGFNLLILLESALSDAFLFRGLDGVLRDLASVHGNYRRVEETTAALHLVGTHYPTLPLHWLLDRPVSNSGRLAGTIRELATANDWPWEVDLVDNPDADLVAQRERPVVSSDRFILDNCSRWFNLGTELVLRVLPQARIVDLNAD